MSTAPQGTIGKLTAWKTTLRALVVAQGFNVRMDMGDIEALAKSIADNGVERPLNVVRGEGDTFELIDGHRRFTAMTHAASKGLIDPATFPVPIMIAERGISDADKVAMMARANDGKPLTPIEEATLFQRLLDMGLKLSDVCAKVGRGDVYVRQHLDLLKAPDAVRDALRQGAISKTLALNISSKAKTGKIDAAALVAQATSSKEGKREATLATDTFQAKQRAIKVKLEAIQEELANVSKSVRDSLKEAGMTKDDLRKVKHYDLIILVGMERALRDLVNENKAEA